MSAVTPITPWSGATLVSLALKQKNDYAAEHPDGDDCNGFGGSPPVVAT